MPPSATRPGDFRAVDGPARPRDRRGLGRVARRRHRCAGSATGPASARRCWRARAVVARFTIAGLLAQRVDEIRLASPVIAAPGPPRPRGGGRAGDGVPARAGRRPARRRYDGSVRVRPRAPSRASPATSPSTCASSAPTPRGARLHQLRVRDMRLRYAQRPTSLVVDDGIAEFTLAGLLERRQVARLRVDAGLLVLDRPLRERMAGRRAGAAPSRRGNAVVRRRARPRPARHPPHRPGPADSRPHALRPQPADRRPARARRPRPRAPTPQRVELSNITLDSPLDPFRPVIHVGSVFVDFTIAEPAAPPASRPSSSCRPPSTWARISSGT